MKKFSTLLLIFACCSLAAADVTQTLNAANQCVQISASGQGTIGIAVAGTWSATLQPEAAVGGQAAANTVVYPVGSTTSQSTIAANGTFTSPVSGLTTFLLCVSAYTSGSATVVLTSSQATSSKTASGGGSGTVTSITAGTGLTGGTITGSGTIALSTPVGVAIGGTGAATLTGPIKGNGTSALTAAAASDIVGLFSTCSGTQYLGADGACHAAGTGSGTVNTGTLGYTAGYPSSSTAVSAYPVRGVITNPFSGADWCLRAQTAQTTWRDRCRRTSG